MKLIDKNKCVTGSYSIKYEDVDCINETLEETQNHLNQDDSDDNLTLIACTSTRQYLYKDQLNNYNQKYHKNNVLLLGSHLIIVLCISIISYLVVSK